MRSPGRTLSVANHPDTAELRSRSGQQLHVDVANANQRAERGLHLAATVFAMHTHDRHFHHHRSSPSYSGSIPPLKRTISA